MASVIVVSKHSSREIVLENTVTVVGRDGGVSLELGDLQVSRRHALLVQATQGYFVKDLGSRNGIMVNQQRVGSRMQVPIRNGDVLNLGRTTLIFKDLGLGEEDDDYQPTVQSVPVVVSVSTTPEARPRRANGTAKPAPARPAPTQPAPQPLELEPEDAEESDCEAIEPQVERPTPRPSRPARRRRAPRKAPQQEIPRAMAPGAAVYSGQAELLALRALVERAERDRVYYRNLALVLFVLLVGTLVVVFMWAMLQHRDGAVAPQPIPNTAPAPEAPVARAQLDAGMFASEVQPILSARCASCHETVGAGGSLELAQSNDPQTVEANRLAALRFVLPGQPERSPLLLKPISPEEGGTEHAGGHTLTIDSTEWLTLRAWVSGGSAPLAPRRQQSSSASGEPPTARISAPKIGVVGEEIEFSAAESTDPEGESITYRWTLIESPEGATATLVDSSLERAHLTPDAPGAYVVALVARDQAATGSVEHTLTVEPKADPSRKAGLQRASESLLGRAPTGRELSEIDGLQGQALVAHFLEQDELYQRWWDSELHFLGLVGANKPNGEPWDSLPRRLKSGKYTVQNAYYALLVGQNWSARYNGRDAYVDAVLEKVLGPEKRKDPALREAGCRLFDGHESTLLGKRTKGQIGLVKVAVAHPEAQRYLLSRSYRSLFRREPSKDVLALAVQRLRKHPNEFFRQLAEWACRGL